MWQAGATLELWCEGFSLWWFLFCCGARALGHVGFSTCSSWALEHRLSSRGTQAWLLHSMWDLPGPGTELVSLELIGGFFTTEPPGKSPWSLKYVNVKYV